MPTLESLDDMRFREAAIEMLEDATHDSEILAVLRAITIASLKREQAFVRDSDPTRGA